MPQSTNFSKNLQTAQNVKNGLLIPPNSDLNEAFHLLAEAVLVPEEDKYSRLFSECRIDFSREYEPPKAILQIGETPLRRGNFSTITGKAKSRKTMLISLIAATYYGWENPLISHIDEGRNGLLYVDTEQSKDDVWRIGKTILRMAGLNPNGMDGFDVLGTKHLHHKDRIEIIEYALYNGNYDLVIVDGVRDLVSNINDSDQATEIVTLLMKWVHERNLHLINLIHQNKSQFDTNARGHLGTELVNKSEVVISVAKDKEQDISIIEAEETRGKPFGTFAIGYNDIEKRPYIVDEYTPILKADKKSTRNVDKNLFIDAVYSTILDNPKITQNELIERVKDRMCISKTTAENHFDPIRKAFEGGKDFEEVKRVFNETDYNLTRTKGGRNSFCYELIPCQMTYPNDLPK